VKSDRLRQIEGLCRDAGEREPGDRAAFLDDACAGDAELRREVDLRLAGPSPADGQATVTATGGSPRSPGQSVRSGRRALRSGPSGIRRMVGAVSQSLALRFRPAAAPDIRCARALGYYLHEAIQDRILRPTPLPPGVADWPAAWRYRPACARLLPSERELIVATIELGYSYEQLALATNQPSAEAARTAAKCALLRLAEEMSRA
jgi:hypothetical protein